MESTVAYQAIKEFYGDRRAARSDVLLMNHVNEGIEILDMIHGSQEAKEAFCLHPIVQSDIDIEKNWEYLASLDVSPKVLILTLEYRNIANQYLSFRSISSINEIKLSPVSDVNDMLVADKIQNYKDFILYHRRTHARSKELDQYFRNWLKRLDIEEKFQTYITLKGM